MPLNTPEIAQIGAIFAGILLLFLRVGGLKARSWFRLKENKLRWEIGEQVKRFRREAQEAIGGAIGKFMQNLANQAAEEEGGSSSGVTPTGAFELGGVKVDPAMIRTFMELYKLAQDIGIIGPGGLQGLLGGGGGAAGSSSGKIGL